MDNVNHPSHYTYSEIEPLDAIEAWGLSYHMGNAVKYIARADHKGQPIEDLEKAVFYLNREIQLRKGYQNFLDSTEAEEVPFEPNGTSSTTSTTPGIFQRLITAWKG